jgi:signal transduction histidine kinase
MDINTKLEQRESNKGFISRFISKYIKNNTVLSIISLYYLVTIIVSVIFYPLIPALLNYSANNEEISAKLGTSNLAQYITIMSISLLIGTILLLKEFKGVYNWDKLNPDKAEDIKEIYRIRKKCINLPYTVFLVQALIVNIPLIPILLVVRALNNTNIIAVIKILVMVFSLMSLAAVISHTFAKRLFKTILIRTYDNSLEKEGLRIGLKNKIFFQIIPMLVLAMLYTALIGYSTLIKEKGDMIYNMYKERIDLKLSDNSFESVGEAFDILEDTIYDNIKSVCFVKAPTGEIITSGNVNISEYLTYFISNPYEEDRIFDLNAETQGIVTIVNNNGEEWRLGVIFKVASERALSFFFIGFIVLLTLIVFVLYYFSKSLSDDISLVADGLTDIASDEYVDLDKMLPVTSNDEIGDLVIAFNKIQRREKEHIEEMKEQHEIIAQQERLASLGQLIGGIAHNMRTPIMSIAGAIIGLKDLVAEYEKSVGDKKVTKKDHEEIANEMMTWLDKMEPYCAYMSDILTAVKEQTTQHEESELLDFSVEDLIKRVKILMTNELSRYSCALDERYNVDMTTRITGDISILVQVINNLITNAVQAYRGSGQKVLFGVKQKDNTVIFFVQDNGMGIRKDVQDRLFKEMVTTKGKEGTGLGLFISYSNIKARFKGDMWFKTEKGKGTTFYISIPVKKRV